MDNPERIGQHGADFVIAVQEALGHQLQQSKEHSRVGRAVRGELQLLQEKQRRKDQGMEVVCVHGACIKNN